MNRKETIISIAIEDSLFECGSKIPHIQTFRITTNEGTEAVFPADQLDKYKVGMVIEVKFE